MKRQDLDTAIGEQTMSYALGGEVAAFLKKVDGEFMLCFCGKQYQVSDFRGYPHTEGLVDAAGNGWWIYVKCPYCNYDMSFGKIETQIEKLELEKQEAKIK
jgi:hypothetical protein